MLALAKFLNYTGKIYPTKADFGLPIFKIISLSRRICPIIFFAFYITIH